MFCGEIIKTFAKAIRRVLWRRRKYPFKLDECSASARKRAFTLFDGGSRPSEIAEPIGISKRTAYRYFEDWKKLGKNFSYRYQGAKAILKNTDFSDRTIALLAQFLELQPQEVAVRIQKPWGIKSMLMGKWPNRRRDRLFSEREKRLYAALRIINLAETGLGLDEIRLIIERLVQEATNNKEADSENSNV